MDDVLNIIAEWAKGMAHIFENSKEEHISEDITMLLEAYGLTEEQKEVGKNG